MSSPLTAAPASSGFRPGAPEWIGLGCGAALSAATTWLIVTDLRTPEGYSNRVYAPPAFGFALLVASYGTVRLRGVPFVLRLLAWPVAVLAGYLGFGLALIIFVGLLRQFAS